MDALALNELIFMPTGQPWQKTRLITGGDHRLAMLRIAIDSVPTLTQTKVSDIEITRSGPSYTIDTLIELRESLGNTASIILILGSDQFRNLPTWHRWSELLNFCHLAVTQRERVSLQNLPDSLETLLQQVGVPHLPEKPAGHICFFSMPPVAVSSTALRAALSTQEGDIKGLVPDAVLSYIRANGLYRPTESVSRSIT